MASDEDISALKRIYEDLRVTRLTGEIPRIVVLTKRFIEHMMDVVGHELIGDILRKLTARINVVRALAIAVPGRLEESGRELAVVMDAIERRDGELAARSLRAYVENAAAASLQRFDETERERESRSTKTIRAPRIASAGRSGAGRK
jgi:DNA-binding GntR family transcriptional regulator